MQRSSKFIEVQHFMYLNISINKAPITKCTIEVQHFMYLNEDMYTYMKIDICN